MHSHLLEHAEIWKYSGKTCLESDGRSTGEVTRAHCHTKCLSLTGPELLRLIMNPSAENDYKRALNLMLTMISTLNRTVSMSVSQTQP